MSDTATEKELVSVVGVKSGITEKANGWFEIQVAVPGSDYPRKMSTKKQELVELARAAGENVMEWHYVERDSGKPNPHKPGSNFIDRWFEGVSPLDGSESYDGQQPEDATATRPTPDTASQVHAGGNGMTKEEWARKDSAGHKRACIAIAVSALSHTMPSDPTPEDLTKFLGRVSTLALAWHSSVLAERDDPAGDNLPFG